MPEWLQDNAFMVALSVIRHLRQRRHSLQEPELEPGPGTETENVAAAAAAAAANVAVLGGGSAERQSQIKKAPETAPLPVPRADGTTIPPAPAPAVAAVGRSQVAQNKAALGWLGASIGRAGGGGWVPGQAAAQQASSRKALAKGARGAAIG